jgi:hypothetical protein
MLLKRELTRKIRLELKQAIEQELAMHSLTLADPVVRERVETMFGS